MDESERKQEGAVEPQAVTAEGVPDNEDVEDSEVVKDVDMDPEDHVNRPDQPDFDPAEREQYVNPPVEPAIGEERRSDDR
ncbi:MAG: hypothetical protein ABWZ91_11415 [Nocardioides sp.]